MSNLKIRCGKCSRVLAVNQDAAGKHISCPSCQSTLVVPRAGANEPTAVQKPSPVPAPNPAPAAPSKVVACPGCGTRLSVQSDAAGIIACPKCSQKLRVGGSPKAAPSTKAPTASINSQTRPLPTQPTSPATTIPAANADDPFASLGSDPLSSPPSPQPRAQRPSRSKGSSFVAQVIKFAKKHPHVAILGALDVAFLFLALFWWSKATVFLGMVTYTIPVIGLLFLPRFHILEKFGEAVGARAAELGAGGAFLLIGIFAIKVFGRLARAQDRGGGPDFSELFTASGVATVCTLLVFITIVMVLWRYFGIVRVVASVMILYMSIALPILTFVVIANALRTVAGATQLDDNTANHDRITNRTQPRRSTTSRPSTNRSSTNRSSTNRSSTSRSSTSRSIKRIPFTIPLPNETHAVIDRTELEPGMQVQICINDKWEWVRVIRTAPPGTVACLLESQRRTLIVDMRDLVIRENPFEDLFKIPRE